MAKKQIIDDDLEPMQGELIPADEGKGFQVYKSNQLIEAQYSLTANEQKLLNAAISKVNPIADYDKDGIPKIVMTASMISDMTGIPVEGVYNFVKKAAKRYHTIPIVKHHSDGEKADFTVINIALRSEWKNGEFSIKFHPDIEPDLVNMQEYTKYALARLRKLSSKYAVRLYELSQRYLKPNTHFEISKILPLEEVHFFLGVASTNEKGEVEITKSYRDFSTFRKRVLDPAVFEVCEYTDVAISYTGVRKGGRKISHIKFSFHHVAAASKQANSVKGLRDRLKEFVEDEKVRNSIIKKYSEISIENNLDYMKSRIESGYNIHKPQAFLHHLLNYDVASLPEFANPFSRLYQRNTPEFDFVNKHVMPNWPTIPDHIRADLQIHGFKSDHIKNEFHMFRTVWNNGGAPGKEFHTDAEWDTPEYEEDFKAWVSSEEMLDW